MESVENRTDQSGCQSLILVELEGTTVSRASVHNISIMEELELGIGDKIEVYKANMIIPADCRESDKKRSKRYSV